MATATVRKQLAQMQADLTALQPREPRTLAAWRADPSRLLTDAGMPPDPWQADLLRAEHNRVLLLASRQCGKSQVAAGLALKEAFLNPGALILLLSPTLRQSGELFADKVKRLFNSLNRPLAATRESALTMQLSNQSRIVSLPGSSEGSVRGYSRVALLIVDEAARVSDELYATIRPMLATSEGKIVALTTPAGKRGWFHDCWQSDEPWQRVKITADQCPRISEQFLAEELRAIGARWHRQEYFCSFESLVGCVFDPDDIAALCSDDVPARPFLQEGAP